MSDPFRPGITHPVTLVIDRDEIEGGRLDRVLNILNGISGDPARAMATRGRLSLAFDGYDDDPRELFEIDDVRRFMGRLDERWPYWFFFLNQVDDGIKLIESCLCDCIEVVPGVSSFDSVQLESVLARHFAALDRYCDALALPEKMKTYIADGIIALFRNSSVEKLEGDDFE